MPLYDYQCKSCGHEFTNVFKIDDRKVPESEPCPECKETGSVIHSIKPVRFKADTLPKNHKGYGQFKEVMENVKANHPGHDL